MRKAILITCLLSITNFLYCQSWEKLNSKSIEFYNKADYKNAFLMAEQALVKATKEFGTEHKNYAITLSQLGLLYYSTGNYESAISYFKESLNVSRKVSGNESIEYATTIDYLVGTYESDGKYESALPLLKEVLSIREKLSGKESIEYAKSLDNLAGLYVKMHNYESAIVLQNESLKIREKVSGKESIEYAKSLEYLAATYESAGKYEPALPLFKEALKIKTRVIGKEHQDYALSLDYLAALYEMMLNYESALPLLKEAMIIREKLSGKESAEYAKSLDNMAGLHVMMQNYDLAIVLRNESLNIWEKVSGKESIEYARSLDYLANTYQFMGNYKSALPLYRESLNIIGKVSGKGKTDYAQTINDLAVLYHITGDYTAALPLYKEAMNIRDRILGQEHPDYARTINDLAELYHATGDYKAALPLFKEAMNIRGRILGQEHPDYARTINDLAELYHTTGDYKTALPLYKEAMNIRGRILGQEHPDYARTIYDLSNLYTAIGDYKAALPLYKEAINIRGKILGHYHPDYIQSINGLAVLYQSIGDYDAAIDLYKEAINIQQIGKVKEDIYSLLPMYYLASLYVAIGDYISALPLYESLKDKLKNVYGNKNHYYTTSLISLGSIYQAIGDYETAMALYKEVISVRQEIFENDPDYAQALYFLASLHLQNGNNKLALSLNDKSKKIFLKFNGSKNPDYAIYLTNLALNYLEMKDCEAAFPLLTEALDIRLKAFGKLNPFYSQSLNNLAWSYQLKGDYKTALPLYQESLNIWLKIFGNNHPGSVVILNNLALLFLEINDIDSCKARINQAFEVTKSNFNFLDALSDREKMSFVQHSRIQLNILYSLGIKLFDKDKSIASNLLNSQMFTQNLLLSSAQRMKQTIHSINIQELNSMLDEYLKVKSYLARVYSLSPEETKSNNFNVDSLEQLSERLEQSLAKRTMVFKDYLNKRHFSWKDVRDCLKPDEAAVSIIRFPYFNKKLTDTIEYAALVVTSETRENPQLVVLRYGPDFEKKLMKQYYSFILPENKGTHTDENSPSCYESFWEEIGKAIGDNKKVVYFCPDGIYHLINLNTIQYPDGKYLCEKKDIILVSSLMELLDEEKPLFDSKKALLVGAPEYFLDQEIHQKLAANFTRGISGGGLYSFTRDIRNDTLKNLPGTKIEIDNINNLLKDHNWSVRCLTGSEALEEAVKNAGNPSVLHIATHGFFAKKMNRSNRKQLEASLLFRQNPLKAVDNPMLRSGLMFSGSQNTLNGKSNPMSQTDDGILTGYEVMDLNLDSTELVVLSACETGLGEIHDGEGVYGLQRAFKIAGAKNMIMSLWQVDDNATQLLMRKFYEFWLEGNTKREAFRMAQDHLRTETEYKDPYYWGGFVYIGMDRPDRNGKLLDNGLKYINYYVWILPLILALASIIYFGKRIFKTWYQTNKL
jgi:tetratricopeptide (TPR) repeat protein